MRGAAVRAPRCRSIDQHVLADAGLLEREILGELLFVPALAAFVDAFVVDAFVDAVVGRVVLLAGAHVAVPVPGWGLVPVPSVSSTA